MIGFTYTKGHSVFCVEGNSWGERIGGRLENYRHSLGKRCCCLGPWLEQRKELAMAVLNIRSWAKNTVRKWDGSCNSRVNFPNIWQLTLNTKIPFQKNVFSWESFKIQQNISWFFPPLEILHKTHKLLFWLRVLFSISVCHLTHFSVNFLSSSNSITFTPYVKDLLVLRHILIRMKRLFST